MKHHTPPVCPYCNTPSKLVNSEEIYGKGHDYGCMWQCAPCDAYVGCHINTAKPFGTLANAATREARKQAHAAFDPLWRGKARKHHTKTRSELYTQLAEFMGITKEEAHIGMLNLDGCNKVLEFVKKWATDVK